MPLANSIKTAVSNAWDKFNNLGTGSHKDVLQQHFGNQGTLGKLDIKSLPTLPDIPPAPSQEAAILARAGRQSTGYYVANDGCIKPLPPAVIYQANEPILPAGPGRTCISISQAFPNVAACSNPWRFITDDNAPSTYPCSGTSCVEAQYAYCSGALPTHSDWSQRPIGYRYSSTSCAPRPNYLGCTSEPGRGTSVGILDYTASSHNPGPFDSTTNGELNGNYGAWNVIRRNYAKRLWIAPNIVQEAGTNQFDNAKPYTFEGKLGTTEGADLCRQIHYHCIRLANAPTTQPTTLPPTTQPTTAAPTLPPFTPAPGAIPTNKGRYDQLSCQPPALPNVSPQPNCTTTTSAWQDGTGTYPQAYFSTVPIEIGFGNTKQYYECLALSPSIPRAVASVVSPAGPQSTQTDRFYLGSDCLWYSAACYEYAHAQNTGFCAPTTQSTTAPTTAATTAVPTKEAPTDPITPKPSSAVQEPSSSVGEPAISSDLVTPPTASATRSLQESSVAPTLSSSTGAQLSSAQENSVNTPSTAISGESSTSLQQSSTRIITPTLTRSPSATQSASVTSSTASSATPSVTPSNSQISSAIDRLMSTFTPSPLMSSSAYVDPQTSEVFVDASSSASFAPSSAPITSFGFSSALPQSSYIPNESAISSYVTAKTSLSSSALSSSLFSSSAAQSFSSYIAPSSAASTGLPGTTSSVFSPAPVLESTPQVSPGANPEVDYYSGSGSGDIGNLTDSSSLYAPVPSKLTQIDYTTPTMTPSQTPNLEIITPTESDGLGPCAIAGIAFGAAALPVAVVVGGVAYAGVKAYQYVQNKRQSWYPQAMELGVPISGHAQESSDTEKVRLSAFYDGQTTTVSIDFEDGDIANMGTRPVTSIN